ncbi:MAG: dTDP-4-dehydrorhamnose 3,5-epimerase [Bacteroidia bacterium]|nr:dTDP-4-dehydrorhamnose 3,5-epimerase [Bacteroidia bacterium]
MEITKTHIDGVLILKPKIYEDSRGGFFESFNKQKLEDILRIDLNFVQDNHSVSRKGVLRGLHYQLGQMAQAKIVRVVSGSVQDVVVDIRPKSPTYGQHVSMELNALERNMIFLPRGMAHGFLALEENTEFLYKCDNYYDPDSERGIRYDDPSIGISWQLSAEELILSEKDRSLPFLNSISL